jgi:hypothetical protein
MEKIEIYYTYILGDIVVVQAMFITTNVLSSNTAHGEVYSIQHYVIQFVSDLLQVGDFLWILRFPPPIKLTPRYNWNIVESGVKHHNHNQWILLIDKKSWITYIKRSITNVNMPEMNMLNRLQNVQFIRIKIIIHIRIKLVKII